MKKALVFATFLAASVVANAETLRVHLAQDFPTTGTMLPAGDYSVSPVIGSPNVLKVQGSGFSAFVFGRVFTTGATYPAAKVELSRDKSLALGNTGKAFALSPKPAK